jgi:hypothetical protein
VTGGYLLGRPAARPHWASQTLLPERIVTASSCIVDFVPGIWALRWAQTGDGDRRTAAAKFGIRGAAVESAIERVTRAHEEGEFLWPCVFRNVGVAQSFAAEFLGEAIDVALLGIGLHREFVAAFLDRCRPLPEQAPPGVYACLASRARLCPEGQALGYEVLGYETCGSLHSWLCNGLETPVCEALGVRPGPLGLIPSYAEARAAAHYCNRDDVETEPVPWHPWLIMLYDRGAGRVPDLPDTG